MRLIADEWSEARFSARWTTEIDFTVPLGKEEVTLEALDSESAPDGLLLRPRSNDPKIVLPPLDHAFDVVTVEMRSSADGHLDVFWAQDGEVFAEERKARVPVRASDRLVRTVVDLAPLVGADGITGRLRIDPLDHDAPLVLARLEVTMASPLPVLERGELLARKVRLGKQVREAFIVSPGATVSKPVTIGPDAVLSFGVGRSIGNGADLRFTVAFRDEGGVTPVLERDLPARGAEEWTDHKVSLRELEGRHGSLEASARVASDGPGGLGFAFWAEPILVERGEAPRRLNVVLLSIDTLGAPHLAAYGAPSDGQRFFTGLARQGVTFAESFTSSSLTHVAHGSLLTGKAPLEGNLLWMGALDGVTLADELRRHGYLTAAFTGGVLVTERLGFDRGFDLFHEEGTLSKQAMGRTDIRDLLRLADAWLRDRPSPWFLFVHSYEVHAPYCVRSAARPAQCLGVAHMKGRNPMRLEQVGELLEVVGAPLTARTAGGAPATTAEDIVRLRDAYRGEIEVVDRELDGFFSRLRRRGQLDDTVIVVTSDHGEAFFEHALLEHGLLYDENLRVPLVIAAPGLPAGVRVAEPAHTLDVVPTVLELVGISGSIAGQGRSLVAAMRGGKLPATGFYSFVPGNGLAIDDGAGKKLIWRFALMQESFGRHELFDRAVDPGERHDLWGSTEPGEARRLAAAVALLAGRLPGIHLSLDDFTGERCRLRLAGNGVERDRLYALGIEVLPPSPEPGAGGWEGTVHVGDDARLIFLGEYGGGNRLAVDLRCEGGRGGDAFLVDFARVAATRTRIVTAGGRRSLAAWRVPPAAPSTGRHGPAGVELDELRALGYGQ